MKNEFEKLLKKNQGNFEKGAPSPDVWQKLQVRLVANHETRARVVRMRRIGLAVAASVLFCVGMLLIVLTKKEPENTLTGVVKGNTQHHVQTIAKKNDTVSGLIKQETTPVTKKREDDLTFTDDETKESLFYYTKLIEIREKQISRLQTIDPELYKQSQKSIDYLNKSYLALKSQLSGSINQEKVLESMIENLQLQERILNNQLQLIKEIELSKDINDEKSVKKI